MRVDEELRKVMKTVADVSPEPPRLSPAGKPHRGVHPAVAVVAGFGVVLLLGLSSWLLVGPGGSSDIARGEADPLAHTDGEYPHLLIDKTGWVVSRVHELPSEAEYDHRSAEAAASLSIEVGDQLSLDALVADRVASASDIFTTTIFGRSATMTRYENSTEWTIMWLANSYVYEFRAGPFESEAEMLDLAGALTRVERDEWVEALGDQVVLPERHGEAVAEMMRDIPLPPTFDPDRMRYDDGVEILGLRLFFDRYQLGAHVTGAATCAWIEYWADAKAAGNNAAVTEAIDAMATSTEWQILNEMDPEGDYPEVVWEIADAMAQGGRMFPDEPNADHWTVETWSGSALGCDHKYPPWTLERTIEP